MQLRNRFEVPTAADAAFTTLLDLEQVATCMPGAELIGSDGDTHQGRLKLRIGPITAAYEGTVAFEEVDRSGLSARLRATGSEIGGQGTASADVVATVRPIADDRSEVEVVTELDIRGKAAQFGRGALGEVTQRVLDQFARNLEAAVLAPAAGTADADATTVTAPATPAAPVSPAASAGDAEAGLDVLSVMWRPVLARVAPVAAALAVGVLIGRAMGRRRTGSTPWSTPPASPGPAWSVGNAPWATAPPWPYPPAWADAS